MHTARLLSLALLVALTSLRAAEPVKPDLTVVPGERVGAITATSTLAALRTAYGEKSVVTKELPVGEGQTVKGSVVFPKSDKELLIYWDEGKFGKRIHSVQVIGKAWAVPAGLAPGSGIADVEKANGGPFKLAGFEWDYYGGADFTGGKLEGKVAIQFMYTTKDSKLIEKVAGDTQFASDAPAMRAVKPTVEKLTIFLGK